MITVPDLPGREHWTPAFAGLSTDKVRRFVWAYLFGGTNAAAAAKWAGYSNASNACDVRGHDLLQRDDVHAALRELSSKYLFSLAPKAIVRLGQLLDERDHPKHFAAVALTMQSTYFPQRQEVQHNHTGSIELNHTDAALEALTYMRSLNVPRETLEQQFGKSGLSRYERMLEERDSKRMKVIEGKVDDQS